MPFTISSHFFTTDHWLEPTMWPCLLRTLPKMKFYMTYDILLLSCSPINNKKSLSAIGQYALRSFVLSVFGKDFQTSSPLSAIFGTPTNSLSRLVGPTLVGCHSHCFTLCVQHIIKHHCGVVYVGQKLTKNLSYWIQAAKLQALTPLKA